jgi:hypothetical protein
MAWGYFLLWQEMQNGLHLHRLLKMAVSKAAASEGPKAYPLGYVEGLNDARTKLAAIFSSCLRCEAGCLPIDDPHSGQDQRDADDFARTH